MCQLAFVRYIAQMQQDIAVWDSYAIVLVVRVGLYDKSDSRSIRRRRRRRRMWCRCLVVARRLNSNLMCSCLPCDTVDQRGLRVARLRCHLGATRLCCCFSCWSLAWTLPLDRVCWSVSSREVGQGGLGSLNVE